MNSMAKLDFAEGTREFCGWVLIGLLALAFLGAMPVYEELSHTGFGSCMSSTDTITALWLVCALPLGVNCVAMHYGVPGPGRGKGWLTHVLAVEFGLVTLGWLGLRVWWYWEMLGVKEAAFECIWWLHPFIWLWG